MNQGGPNVSVMWKAGLGDQDVFFLALLLAKCFTVQAHCPFGFQIVLLPKGGIHARG